MLAPGFPLHLAPERPRRRVNARGSGRSPIPSGQALPAPGRALCGAARGLVSVEMSLNNPHLAGQVRDGFPGGC